MPPGWRLVVRFTVDALALSLNSTESTSRKDAGVTPKASQFVVVPTSHAAPLALVQVRVFGPSSSTRSMDELSTLLEMKPTVLGVGVLPRLKLKPAPPIAPPYLTIVNCAG